MADGYAGKVSSDVVGRERNLNRKKASSKWERIEGMEEQETV